MKPQAYLDYLLGGKKPSSVLNESAEDIAWDDLPDEEQEEWLEKVRKFYGESLSPKEALRAAEQLYNDESGELDEAADINSPHIRHMQIALEQLTKAIDSMGTDKHPKSMVVIGLATALVIQESLQEHLKDVLGEATEFNSRNNKGNVIDRVQ